MNPQGPTGGGGGGGGGGGDDSTVGVARKMIEAVPVSTSLSTTATFLSRFLSFLPSFSLALCLTFIVSFYHSFFFTCNVIFIIDLYRQRLCVQTYRLGSCEGWRLPDLVDGDSPGCLGGLP